MSEGKEARTPTNMETRVAAVERLSRSGWWNLNEEERKILSSLLSRGLRVHVNLAFGKLGLKPALVLGRTRGSDTLWDVVGTSSFALRSHYSSSVGHLLLAAPKLPFDVYRSAWLLKMRQGLLETVSIHPLTDIRGLMVPIDSFNEDTSSFDFTWQSLPRRRYEEPQGEEKPAQYTRQVVSALNALVENPQIASLSEISDSTGVSLAACYEATKFVRDYPVSWGYYGTFAPSQAGLVLVFTQLSEGLFGAVRAGIRDVPFTSLEAWGQDSTGFIYYAEMAVPGFVLSETLEYVGKLSAPCGDSFSYGFYDTDRFSQYSLPETLADQA